MCFERVFKENWIHYFLTENGIKRKLKYQEKNCSKFTHNISFFSTKLTHAITMNILCSVISEEISFLVRYKCTRNKCTRVAKNKNIGLVSYTDDYKFYHFKQKIQKLRCQFIYQLFGFAFKYSIKTFKNIVIIVKSYVCSLK